METQLSALLHRLKLAEHNKNPKYRQYASGADFYTKIGNKMDEMMRVSNFLTKFLTSTPPMLSRSTHSEIGEELTDYDDLQVLNNSTTGTLDYDQPDDYTLYSLKDLPIVMDAELDSNLMVFHSFIAFIKPATYFIHKHEMVPPTRRETRKENATRVLMNIVQLLIFSRSLTESSTDDIFAMIHTLFYRFPHYFTILKDEEANSDANDVSESDIQTTHGIDTGRSFFEEFSEQAAQFFIILIAYDERHITIEELREEIKYFISSPLAAHPEDFRKALESHQFVIQSCSEQSSSTSECCKKLREHFTITDFKSQILSVAKTLATKVLKRVRDVAIWDLDTTYLDMNYERLFEEMKKSHDLELKELRSKIEQEVQDVEEQEKDELRAKVSSAEQESRLLLEQSKIQEQEIKFLRTENARLKEDLVKAKSSNGDIGKREFKYQDLERTYPELIATVKNQTFRIATKKAYTRIEQLEAELEKLRHIPENSDNGNSNMGYNQNGSSATREPDQVEEPEFYEQSITNYNNGHDYYNRAAPGRAPYFNHDRSYRPPTRGGGGLYGRGRGGGGAGSFY